MGNGSSFWAQYAGIISNGIVVVVAVVVAGSRVGTGTWVLDPSSIHLETGISTEIVSGHVSG